MASFLLARSSRLFKHFACSSFTRTPRPTLVSVYASHCSTVTRFDSNWKRDSFFLLRRQISSSAFVTNVASSDVQEENVDVYVHGNGSLLEIKNDINREISEDNDMDLDNDLTSKSINGCKIQEVACTHMVEEDMILKTADPIDGADIQDVSRLHTVETDTCNNLNDGYDIQDVASAHPVDGDTCLKITDKIIDEIDDVTHIDSMVMHVAHMLGIIEYENLAVLQGAASCTEDELFSNLSFLMSIGFTEKQLVDTIYVHPYLMAMDLDKSLNRVIRCTQKLGLDASFLKQVLLVEPGLVPLLAKRALQERVKALRELDFSADDIATLLKQLGCIQFELFLSLPVEKMRPTFTYITDDIGMSTSNATKLISSFPSVLLRDVEKDYASKMKILKEVFEELKKVKKLFVHLPELLARKTEMLEETVMFLKDMVKDVKKLRDFIEAYPALLTHRKSGIQQVSKYLQSLGFDSETAVALIAREPYLVECGSDRLQKHVEFLKSKNFDESAVRGLLKNSTGMFFKSLQKRVAPKIEFLERQGITGESLQKYIKSRPQVCDKSLRNSMTPNLDFLLSLGFEKNSSSLKSALKVCLPHSHKSMQARIDYLISLGIETADVHKMVRETPSVLVISDSSLKKRVDFLVKVIKYPVQDLVKCPTFLLSNINRTIMPRLKVFEWLSSKGLLKKFSLSTLVETEEAIFVKKFVAAHPEALSIYKGSPQS